MIRIGIELNNVYRNVNAQILKYVSKSMNELLEPNDCDDKNMVVSDDYEGMDESMVRNLVRGKFRFASKVEKERFLYEDYPLEVFGHANLSEKGLDVLLNEFAERHSEDVEFVFFSCEEVDLSIMATCFFLSKTSTKRARKIVFPVNSEDIWKECDVVVTTDPKFLSQKERSSQNGLLWKLFSRKPKRKVVIINRKFNRDDKGLADLRYDSLSDALKDEELINKLSK